MIGRKFILQRRSFSSFSRRSSVYAYNDINNKTSPKPIKKSVKDSDSPLLKRSKSEIMAILEKDRKDNGYDNNKIQQKHVKDFVKTYVGNIDEAYNNLDKLSLTTVKRACIRNWLEEHGGNYFSLKILPNHNWIKLIDSGSFSSAHLVKSDKDEMQVVKITKDNNTKSAVREIKLLTSIDHPHIVKLYDHGHINGSFWSLIEYCNMSSVSNMGLPLPIEKRLICLSHVINGLEYLHSLGIAHRDIKSDNIFVHIENDLTMFKLGDFNLARNISDNDDSITPLSFCGSYYTMAPEILNKQTYDVRCDMWSYLCLLIEISDGRHNNPLCISTENLINSTSELHSIELQIIRMLHYIDPELRKNALEIKIILDDLIKSSEINNSNTARRCRSQSL